MRVTGSVRPLSLAMVAVAFAAMVVGAGPVARAATPPPGAFAVGDSVMAGARQELRAQGITRVDAATSRQSYVGPSRLRRAGAGLPRDVVIHLGTNGTLPKEVCHRMVDIAGPNRHVFLVTVHAPVRWKRADNDVIRRCAAAYPVNRVTVVDWDAAAAAHPRWLYADHTHLRPAGAHAYAALIAAAIASSPH